MKKYMKEIEETYKQIEIESYDYDMDPDMIEKWNVGEIIPVLIFLDEDGNEISRLIGEKKKSDVIKEIERLL